MDAHAFRSIVCDQPYVQPERRGVVSERAATALQLEVGPMNKTTRCRSLPCSPSLQYFSNEIRDSPLQRARNSYHRTGWCCCCCRGSLLRHRVALLLIKTIMADVWPVVDQWPVGNGI